MIAYVEGFWNVSQDSTEMLTPIAFGSSITEFVLNFITLQKGFDLITKGAVTTARLQDKEE